jgi:hypothetical protein
LSDASDAAPEALDEFSVPDIANPPGPSNCTIGVAGVMNDPVALCFQGDLLKTEVNAAYVPGQGVAQMWDDSGHTSGHAWQDDLGLASAIASFVCSAEFYGNTEYDAALRPVLGDLAKVIPPEFPSGIAGYDGEVYFRLRNAEAGYNYLNGSPQAATFSAMADAYARAIQGSYAQTVPAPGDGGAPGLVIGTPDKAGGIDYAPAQVIMASAALLDMALLHGSDPDAGTDPATWQSTALAALDYVWRRGRDPVTGLFYQSLVTSSDPAHDTPLPGTPTSDALLTDVQAAAILGLARTEDRFDTLQAAGDAGLPDGGANTEPYLAEADILATALTGSAGIKLWDGAASSGTTPGAFVEGVVPSDGNALMTDKTTAGNAFLLGGIHRLAIGRGTKSSYVLGQIRAALLQITPAHSSLFTVVTNASGIASQDGYLRASSRNWNYATVFMPGGGGAEEPSAREYRADALNAVAEGFNQLWYGGQNAPQCAP